MSAIIDVVTEARRNVFYRRVLYTGARSQTVVMSLQPGEGIGFETHRQVEQSLVIIDGYGSVLLDGRREPFRPGDLIVISPGTRHNLVAGPIPVKLFTVYTPPNHLPGRVHRTRAEADADVEDEAFGRRAR